jgi:hypothetical protein
MYISNTRNKEFERAENRVIKKRFRYLSILNEKEGKKYRKRLFITLFSARSNSLLRVFEIYIAVLYKHNFYLSHIKYTLDLFLSKQRVYNGKLS